MLRTVKGKYMLLCEKKSESQLMQMSMRKLRYVSQASKEKEAHNLRYASQSSKEKEARNLRFASQSSKEKMASNLTQATKEKEAQRIYMSHSDKEKAARRVRSHSTLNIGVLSVAFISSEECHEK